MSCDLLSFSFYRIRYFCANAAVAASQQNSDAPFFLLFMKERMDELIFSN